MFNEWIDGGDFDGATVFEHAQSLGLEGIVSKRKGSRYVSGRSPYWLKMRIRRARRHAGRRRRSGAGKPPEPCRAYPELSLA